MEDIFGWGDKVKGFVAPVENVDNGKPTGFVVLRELEEFAVVASVGA